jgi:hypothetical protein
MSYWHEGVGPWMVAGGTLMLLFWAGLIGLTTWGIAGLTWWSHSGKVALAIARERYAPREISEGFDRVKRDLP